MNIKADRLHLPEKLETLFGAIYESLNPVPVIPIIPVIPERFRISFVLLMYLPHHRTLKLRCQRHRLVSLPGGAGEIPLMYTLTPRTRTDHPGGLVVL